MVNYSKEALVTEVWWEASHFSTLFSPAKAKHIGTIGRKGHSGDDIHDVSHKDPHNKHQQTGWTCIRGGFQCQQLSTVLYFSLENLDLSQGLNESRCGDLLALCTAEATCADDTKVYCRLEHPQHPFQVTNTQYAHLYKSSQRGLRRDHVSQPISLGRSMLAASFQIFQDMFHHDCSTPQLSRHPSPSPATLSAQPGAAAPASNGHHLVHAEYPSPCQ